MFQYFTFPEQLIPKEKILRPVKYLKATELENRIIEAYTSKPKEPTAQPTKSERKPEEIAEMLNTPADSLAAAVHELKNNAAPTSKSALYKKSDISV